MTQETKSIKENQNNVLMVIPVIIAMIFWGTAWSSGKLISGMVSADVIVFWRFAIAFISMIPVITMLKLKISITRKEFFILILGAVFYTAYNQLFFKGLLSGLAGAGGVLVTTTNPLITHLLVILIYRQKISQRSFFGLIIGLIGGFFLLQLWTLKSSEILQGGNALFLLASLMWSCLSLCTNKVQSNLHYLVASSYLMLFSAILQFFFAWPNQITSVFQYGFFFWGNLVYLGVIAMAFSSTIYFLATRKFGSHKASSFIFIVPTSALVTSFVILGEIPQWYTVVGGIIAILAVYLINSKAISKNSK
ncbi:MAG: DMT family transporter [Spirochaetes bacterium]|nr:DMT family transporter [Spirochaetota bacterium]